MTFERVVHHDPIRQLLLRVLPRVVNFPESAFENLFGVLAQISLNVCEFFDLFLEDFAGFVLEASEGGVVFSGVGEVQGRGRVWL